MTLDRDEAAASLSDIANVERRTRETVVYARSSTILIMWGVLCVIGYVFCYVEPAQARPAWIAIAILGFVGTFVSGHWRRPSERRGSLAQSLFYAQLALIGYGLVLLVLLWPVDPRQLSAFWPTLIMLGFVLMGLWLGRFFILCGVAVTALTVVGYFWSGAWFPLWMAVVNGGGLLAGGVWLRRLR
ncbi:MAG TPA: hypothetical protein VJO12_15450 [Stellaceae bacterium]|nr:hypothetical protein [Stellaceae bacterium]